MKYLICFSLLLSAASAQGIDQLRGRKLANPAQQEYDCDSGCDLKGPVVCGVDGFTYRNGCLATCQEVAIEKNGACQGDPPGKIESEDEEGTVDLETMNRYKQEKFKLVGKRKFLPLEADFVFDEMDEEKDSGNNGNGNNGNNGKGPKDGKVRALRVEDTGYEYMAEYDENEDDLVLDEELPPFDPEPEPEESESDPGDRRGLKVIGTDTRARVSPYYTFPNRIIGEMDYDWNENGIFGEEGGCSGTIVSKDSVLTAGHCVFDYNSGSGWLPHSRFAPARYRNSAGSTVEPYGRYSWRTMTTYTKWTKEGRRSYDMAVIKYRPDSSGRLIGDRLGYAGWASVSDGNAGKLDNSYIAGYPADKPHGTLWRSGTCNHWCYRTTLWWCAEDHLSKHSCDTFPAMSGSAVMSASGYVYGVHVAAGSGNYNVAVLLHGRNVDKFKQWAGR